MIQGQMTTARKALSVLLFCRIVLLLKGAFWEFRFFIL